MLVYPLVWTIVFLLTGFFMTASFAASANHSTKPGGIQEIIGFAVFFIMPFACMMGIVGCFHLVALHFMQTKAKNNIVRVSTKIGLIIGTLMFLFLVSQIVIVPDITDRIRIFGLPAFITSIASGYILGLLSHISQSKTSELGKSSD